MKTKEFGEVVKVEYIDGDEDGFTSVGFFIESENKGTLIKVEEDLKNDRRKRRNNG